MDPVRKHYFSLRDSQNPSRETNFPERTGTGKNMFPCSAGHEQDWQLCPVDLYSAKSADDTYINNSLTDTFQRKTKSGGLRWVRTRLEVHG